MRVRSFGAAGAELHPALPGRVAVVLVMLIEEFDLVLSRLFRTVSLFVVSCVQRRSMARGCAISQVSGLSWN